MTIQPTSMPWCECSSRLSKPRTYWQVTSGVAFSSGSTVCGIFAMGSAMASAMTWMFCFPSLFHLSAQGDFMEIDEEKVDEAVLALLYLTTLKDKLNLQAWQSDNLDSLDLLPPKGYISQ